MALGDVVTALLLPWYPAPAAEPATWPACLQADAAGTRRYVVIDDPTDPVILETAERLVKAGVVVLGRVATGFALRPLAELLDEVEQWAGSPATGVLLDEAPTSPFSLGPVRLATRVARRVGLPTVLLNPGVPTDPLYRALGLPLCTFEGSWLEYRRWNREGSYPGDGHLVHSVPVDALPAAWRLLQERGAGFGLVTDRSPPAAYAELPGWLPAPGELPLDASASAAGHRTPRPGGHDRAAACGRG